MPKSSFNKDYITGWHVFYDAARQKFRVVGYSPRTNAPWISADLSYQTGFNRVTSDMRRPIPLTSEESETSHTVFTMGVVAGKPDREAAQAALYALAARDRSIVPGLYVPFIADPLERRDDAADPDVTSYGFFRTRDALELRLVGGIYGGERDGECNDFGHVASLDFVNGFITLVNGERIRISDDANPSPEVISFAGTLGLFLPDAPLGAAPPLEIPPPSP